MRVPEEPSDPENIDPLTRGNLMHETLEAFFREQRERGRPAMGEAWTGEDEVRVLELFEGRLQVARDRGLTGLPVFSRQDERALRADLRRFLVEDTAFRRRTGAIPHAFERHIDVEGPAGQRFRGYIDRVDRAPRGRGTWIVDYKTGRKPDDDASPLSDGTKLQLPVYLLDAPEGEPATALYWYISARGDFAQVEYTATPATREVFARVIAAAAGGVGAGSFPAVPGPFNEHWGEFENCGRCDFTRICTRARGGDFARKEGSEGVAPWSGVAARGPAGRGRMSADDAARREISERLDATMLVEAGAGTGKTRALVDRVVALVERGTPIERIAAITFTERAAAELRERVRDGLEARRAEAGTGTEVGGRCDTALGDLDRAQLSTIHAFGQGLLRSMAAEAGIDPEMTVLDQLAAERRFEERWRAALESIDPDGADGRALDRALGVGLTLAGLRDLTIALAEREDIAETVRTTPPAPAAPDWDELAGLRADLTALPLAAVPGEDTCLLHILELLAALDAVIAGDGMEREAALAAAAGVCGARLGNRGRKGNWGGDVASARATATAVGARLLQTLEVVRADALAGILPWLSGFVIADAGARRRDGTLVFNDLILWTRDLLRDAPEARAELRARFDALLIDEFQDTDPWQVDIAEAFARAADGALEPGRLFLVGDPKQSIYRFRRADMAAYASERARVVAGGGLLPELTENRRSRAVLRRVGQHGRGRADRRGDGPVDPGPVLADRGRARRRPPRAGGGLDGRRVRGARVAGAPGRGGGRRRDLPRGGRRGLAGAGARRRRAARHPQGHRGADPHAHRAERPGGRAARAPGSRSAWRAAAWCSAPRSCAT